MHHPTSPTPDPEREMPDAHRGLEHASGPDEFPLLPHERLARELRAKSDLHAASGDPASADRLRALAGALLAREVKPFPLKGVFAHEDVVTSYGFDTSIRALAMSPDNKLVAIGGGDGTVRVMHLTERDVTGRLALVAEFRCLEGVSSLAFHPGGRNLAVGSMDRTLRVLSIYERDDYLRPKTVSGLAARDAITSLSFSPYGGLLAVGSGIGENGAVRLLARAGDGGWSSLETVRLFGAGGGCPGLAFGPDGESFAIAGSDLLLYRISVGRRGYEAAPVARAGETAVSVSFSPDAELLAAGGGVGGGRTVRILSARKIDAAGRPLLLGSVRLLRPVRSVEFSPDGESLLVLTTPPPGGSMGQALVLETSSLLRLPRGTGAKVAAELWTERALWSACFSPDGSMVLAGGDHSIAWVFGKP